MNAPPLVKDLSAPGAVTPAEHLRPRPLPLPARAPPRLPPGPRGTRRHSSPSSWCSPSPSARSSRRSRCSSTSRTSRRSRASSPTRRSRSSGATSTSARAATTATRSSSGPFRYETERYGEYSKAGEYVYDHPFQWGSKRTGPDLHRVGGKYPSLWHVRHMDRPALDDAGLGHAALPAPADGRLRRGLHRLEDARPARRRHALHGRRDRDAPRPPSRPRRRRSPPRSRRSRARPGSPTRRSRRSRRTSSGSAPTSSGRRSPRRRRSPAAPAPPAAPRPAPADPAAVAGEVAMLQELAARTGATAWAIASMLFFLGVWVFVAVRVFRARPEDMDALRPPRPRGGRRGPG